MDGRVSGSSNAAGACDISCRRRGDQSRAAGSLCGQADRSGRCRPYQPPQTSRGQVSAGLTPLYFLAFNIFYIGFSMDAAARWTPRTLLIGGTLTLAAADSPGSGLGRTPPELQQQSSSRSGTGWHGPRF